MPNAPAIVTSFIVAFWVCAIAIIAIQNATPVSLTFLFFQSISIPIGLIIAFSVGVGLIVAALFKPVLELGNSDLENRE